MGYPFVPIPQVSQLQYAKPGPYVTALTPQEEQQFQEWVKANNVPFENDTPNSDYDLRGFWKAAQSGDPNASTAINREDGRIHYPDTYKTPYSNEGFSRQSKYALPSAGDWVGDVFAPPNVNQGLSLPRPISHLDPYAPQISTYPQGPSKRLFSF